MNASSGSGLWPSRSRWGRGGHRGDASTGATRPTRSPRDRTPRSPRRHRIGRGTTPHRRRRPAPRPDGDGSRRSGVYAQGQAPEGEERTDVGAADDAVAVEILRAPGQLPHDARIEPKSASLTTLSPLKPPRQSSGSSTSGPLIVACGRSTLAVMITGPPRPGGPRAESRTRSVRRHVREDQISSTLSDIDRERIDLRTTLDPTMSAGRSPRSRSSRRTGRWIAAVPPTMAIRRRHRARS